MNNIDHFVGHFENVVPKDFCNELISKYADQKWSLHNWKTADSINVQYNSSEPEVFYLKNETDNKIKNTLRMFSMLAIDRYQNDKRISVGVSQVHDYRLNRYQKSCFMRSHIDHIHDLFDGAAKGIPILSIIINLNDEYCGGELVFFENLKFKLKTGDILIFPSNFLFPHSVEAIANGVRYSAVSWAY